MRDGVEEVVVARVEARVHHAAGHTKHGTTSVLDLNVKGAVTGFGVFDLGGEGVSSWDGSGGSIETTWKVLGTTSVLAGGHGDEFSGGTEKSNLGQSEGGDVAQGGETHTVIEDAGEGVVTGQVKGSWEGNAEFLDHHTDEGKHGDTSVLDFDGTTTGETIGVVKKTKGVEKVQGTRVDTKTVRGTGITHVKGGAAAHLRSRGEGSGGGNSGGEDGEFHFDYCNKVFFSCESSCGILESSTSTRIQDQNRSSTLMK